MSSIDRLTAFAMNQVSRRGFLKGLGGVGVAFAAVVSGLGSKLRQAAAVQCQGSFGGPCSSCYSACIGIDGSNCVCSCPGCNCQPPRVLAYCNYQYVGVGTCILSCSCPACT